MTAPNPCGTMNGIYALISAMLDNIYNDGERVFGRIVYEARCEVIQQYFPNQSMYGPAVIYATLGDPALRLKYPYSPSVAEREFAAISGEQLSTKIISGPLLLPEGGSYRIFDITGKEVSVNALVPGLYFVSSGNQVIYRIVKIK